MQINADFTQPALVHPSSTSGWPHPRREWNASCLDRTGAERGGHGHRGYAPDPGFRTTSTQRVKKFGAVGCFSEGDHHYPQGWYLRNPAASGLRLHSAEGAAILWKLGHLPPAPAPSQASLLRINTHDTACWATEGEHAA